MHHRRKVELREGRALGWQKIRHYQDSRAYACLTQSNAFFDIRNREPGRAFGLERARHFESPVPVCIGFDHWHDLGMIAHYRAHRTIVGADRSERDFYPAPQASLFNNNSYASVTASQL